MVLEPACVDHELFRHAAPDHARPADAEFFRDHDPGAMGRRDPRGAHAAGSRADHEEIDIVASHSTSSTILTDNGVIASLATGDQLIVSLNRNTIRMEARLTEMDRNSARSATQRSPFGVFSLFERLALPGGIVVNSPSMRHKRLAVPSQRHAINF